MNYFFSKVQLNTQAHDRELLRNLSCNGDAYRDHALIWRLFPGDGQKRDFLFRREREGAGPLSYYVVSRRPPRAEPGLLNIQFKPYSPQLTSGEWLRFSLRANPVVSRKSANGISRRHDVLMDAKRLSENAREHNEAMDAAALLWLLKRAPEWGLSVREGSVLTNGYTQHRLRQKGRNIEFSTLDYHGLAQVNDTERLTKVLLQGVGHSRGFGCGLLLVKRVAPC